LKSNFLHAYIFRPPSKSVRGVIPQMMLNIALIPTGAKKTAFTLKDFDGGIFVFMPMNLWHFYIRALGGGPQ
jgi:hypothetical protein